MFGRSDRRNRAISLGKQAVRQAASCVTEPLERRVLLSASGFIFVVNGKGIGEYTTSGATVNAKLITGLNQNPVGIAVSGSDLFVLSQGTLANSDIGTVGEYTTSGATVNAKLITGLKDADCIAASASDLFVGLIDGGAVEYTTSGSLVNDGFVSYQEGSISAITVSGSDVFVVNETNGSIAEYTTSDTFLTNTLGPSPLFVNDQEGIVVSGADMFFTQLGAISDGQGDYQSGYGQISEYTTTGTLVNASLGGFQYPDGIAVLGRDMFITYDGDQISEFTTSGKKVNTKLVTRLSDAYPLVVIPASNISGDVYNVHNGDGMAGVTVTLQPLQRGKPKGNASNTTTDSNGDYSFTGLAAGIYSVSETLPSRYKLITPSSVSYTITLSAEQSSTGNNFGDKKKRGRSDVAFAMRESTPFTTTSVATFAVSETDSSVLLFGSQDKQDIFTD